MKRRMSNFILLFAGALLVLAGLKWGQGAGSTLQGDTKILPSETGGSTGLVLNRGPASAVQSERSVVVSPTTAHWHAPPGMALSETATVSPFGPSPKEAAPAVSIQNESAMRDSPNIVWPRHAVRQ